MTVTCHLCGSTDTEVIEPDFDLHFVTSDARPWYERAVFQACASCEAIQKITDANWKASTKEIYKSYNIYQQSGGSEQRVFHGRGVSDARSEVILQKLFAAIPLPESGRLLDLGCGNGGLLASMHSVAPSWQLYGTELGDKNRPKIESLPGVRGFFDGPIERLPWASFDVATLIHLLEHVPNPEAYLQAVGSLLNENGIICVECPNIEANPFDLVIYDHCSHFSPSSFSTLCYRAGLEIVASATDWVNKELSVIARSVGHGQAASPHRQTVNRSIALTRDHLVWLRHLAEGTRELAKNSKPFGIFGTSIAAAWCQHQTSDAAEFFVDEDPNRIGRTFMGKPIFGVGSEPMDSSVLICLPGPDAERVVDRIGKRTNMYISPGTLLGESRNED